MYYTLLKRQALTCIYAHYLIYFPAGPLSKELLLSYFTDEETNTQKSEATCLRSRSLKRSILLV